MDVDLFLKIIRIVLYAILGALSLYFETNAKLNKKVTTYISEAENIYKDAVKSGGEKHNYVVEKLYNLIPVYLKPIFSYEMVAKIVDQAFDSIEKYGKMQLDKAVDKVIK